MFSKLDRIFNPYFLLILNGAIIILAELTAGGRFFYETGLIHIIAVAFVVLATSRIFLHYYTFDPVLEKFLHAVLFGLLIFAGSHILEFISFEVLHEYKDAVFANVVNVYIISLIAIAIGAEIFIRSYRSGSRLLISLLILAAALPVFLIVALLLNSRLVSLEPYNFAPYIYAAVVVSVGILAFLKTSRIKKMVPVTTGFSSYVLAGIVLIVLATLPNIFYEFLQNSIGIPEYQTVYFSHFTFYLALSAMFLAFRKLSYLGGIYEDLKILAKKQ